ncbi:Glycoside hydrolase, subgroup, catalytic core [Niveomyces insectorum RCEF 264]|uniref:mannan endo-1,4-beta-mannosidase n=1 Tax=Niveomyces insectorum RCEF 264 TaxID=1081102 RepID=A0A168AH68_9HYPO|nr:Glycoside hydrolase, subgroup, catalytic core [Niveomyces insectorum RCEF 264]
MRVFGPLLLFLAAAELPAVAAAALRIRRPQQPNATLHGGEDDVRNLPVVREGSRLLLGGRPWKAVGPNVYWLGLDENVTPPAGAPFYAPTRASYPTKGRITEIMATVRALGGTAIRAHTLGVSTGNPLSVWPTARATNADAFEAIDWAVHQARVYGLRLLVPLTDNYDYYHGGKFNFLRWAGFALDGNRDARNPLVQQFYTNATVVALFHDYVTTLLTHVNRYTNLTYAADPTIFAYETGNELTGPVWGDMDVPADWLRATARLVKTLAPGKLVADGTYGVNRSHLADVAEIDFVSDHFYPVSVAKLEADLALVAAANKSYLAGEYSWTGGSAASTASTDGALAPFFRALEASPAAGGDMFWSLFGHNVPDCNVYVNHSDGLALQYGNPANTADTTKRIQLIRQHFLKVSQNASIAADAALPAVPCPAPDAPAATSKYVG